jgi:hypothetical protein
MQVQAINNMHSSSVTGQDLTTFSELLANYSARVGPRLSVSARNAQHVQLLHKVLNCLSNALYIPQTSTAGTEGVATGGQQGNIAHGASGAVHSSKGASAAQPGLSDPAGQFEGVAMSINQFLFNLEAGQQGTGVSWSLPSCLHRFVYQYYVLFTGWISPMAHACAEPSSSFQCWQHSIVNKCLCNNKFCRC